MLMDWKAAGERHPGEALRWPVGLERKLKGAKAFYGILAVATLIGLMINFTKLDPIKALVWAAVSPSHLMC